MGRVKSLVHQSDIKEGIDSLYRDVDTCAHRFNVHFPVNSNFDTLLIRGFDLDCHTCRATPQQPRNGTHEGTRCCRFSGDSSKSSRKCRRLEGNRISARQMYKILCKLYQEVCSLSTTGANDGPDCCFSVGTTTTDRSCRRTREPSSGSLANIPADKGFSAWKRSYDQIVLLAAT